MKQATLHTLQYMESNFYENNRHVQVTQFQFTGSLPSMGSSFTDIAFSKQWWASLHDVVTALHIFSYFFHLKL
jgi:hypothetical protein